MLVVGALWLVLAAGAALLLAGSMRLADARQASVPAYAPFDGDPFVTPALEAAGASSLPRASHTAGFRPDVGRPARTR